MIPNIKSRHRQTLGRLFGHPSSGNIRWADIESLLLALGARLEEREGSRILVRLLGERRVFHRPHPEPTTDKGAVTAIRKWLEENGITP